jgi:CBS domain-containing protein
MGETVRSVKSPDPATLPAESSVAAARLMRQLDCGDVIVTDNGSVVGIATDRDIVVRCVAAGHDPAKVLLRDVCTKRLFTLDPADPVSLALDLMVKEAIRRLPVMTDGKAVVIVSLGDLALARDRKSVLGKVSAAPPNQ